MTDRNAMLTSIEQANNPDLARREVFSRDLSQGQASLGNIPMLKQKHPFRGIVPIHAGGNDGVMFHAHDDLSVPMRPAGK